jgi:integrase
MAARRANGEGGVSRYDTKAGDRWTITYRIPNPSGRGTRQIRERGYLTKRDATTTLRERISDVAGQRHVAKSSLTLREFVETRWLPALSTQVRASTYASYERNLRVHVIPRLGDVSLQALDGGRLTAMYADLLARGRADHKQGSALSPRTVRYIHTIVRKALQTAVKWQLVQRNAADAAEPPKARAASRVAGSTEPTTWSRQEVARFLEATREHRHHAAFTLLATTGMRRGEVLGLVWNAVDLEAGRLSVGRSLVDVDPRLGAMWSEPKTARSRRTVALDAATVAVLRTHRARQAEERLWMGAGYTDSGLLFAMPDGQPIHPDRFTRTFTSLVKRHGLPVIRVHDLRHTWATLALQAGVHPKVVSERLGHSTTVITLDLYSHVAPAMDADAAERVAALIGMATLTASSATDT